MHPLWNDVKAEAEFRAYALLSAQVVCADTEVHALIFETLRLPACPGCGAAV